MRALNDVSADFDTDHVMFAHVDPLHLPCHERLGETAFPEHRGQPYVLSCRDGEVLDASVGRHCAARLRRQVDRLLRDDPGPSLLTRLFRFASGA